MPAMTEQSLSSRYAARVAAGAIRDSDAQRAAITAFEQVQSDLAGAEAELGWLQRVMGRRPEPVKGLYIWGGVGRGKTMLMDMFFRSVATKEKRRTHFHAFMGDVHDSIARSRSAGREDPIRIAADEILERTRLLCFDELHITDITDAMLVGRLFERLFAGGLVVVATSNVPPDGLYKDGLNRALFEPFIALIEQHMHVYAFPDGEDYRLAKLKGKPLYFTPANADADHRMTGLWHQFAADGAETSATLDVQGRTLHVPRRADGAAWFTFEELCDRPVGSRDYLAIAREFHTVFLSGVPRLGPEKRNAARRLINLVDTLYDNRVGLIASADAEPDELYVAGDGVDLFARTASRLVEMRSESYLADRKARLAQRDVEEAKDASEAGIEDARGSGSEMPDVLKP
ncbi:MAG: cell division protein ZapE [Pseudomonadota bacterium]